MALPKELSLETEEIIYKASLLGVIKIVYVIIVCMLWNVTFTHIFVYIIIIFSKQELNPLLYEIE